MDIGSLTGSIELDDNLSSKLLGATGTVHKFSADYSASMESVAKGTGSAVTSVGSLTASITKLGERGSIVEGIEGSFDRAAESVIRFGEKFEGLAGSIAIVAAAAVGAVGALTVGLVALGEKGSTIQGVEDAFDRLATAAGSAGDVLRENLTEGVKGTVNEFELMQSVSRAMTAGVKLNATDMLTLGEAARAMGKATGTDAANGLQIMSTALASGQTRLLKRVGIVVDSEAAEKKFAASVGLTADQLNAAGQLEAKRIGIMDAARAYVERLGVSQLTFKERVQQAEVALEEWGVSIAKAVNSSSHVSDAFDAIGAALTKNFGGAGQTAFEVIVGWIDKFADAVATYGPMIIDKVVAIWTAIRNLAAEVRSAWDLVPDWVKRIGLEAVVAGTAVSLLASSFKLITGAEIVAAGGGIIGTLSSVGKALAEFGGYIATVMSLGWGGLAILLEDVGAGLSSVGLMAAGAITPLGWFVIGTTAVVVALHEFGYLSTVVDYLKAFAVGAGRMAVDAFDALKVAITNVIDNGFVQLGLALMRLTWSAYVQGVKEYTSAVVWLAGKVVDVEKATISMEAALVHWVATLPGIKQEIQFVGDAFDYAWTKAKDFYGYLEEHAKKAATDIKIEGMTLGQPTAEAPSVAAPSMFSVDSVPPKLIPDVKDLTLALTDYKKAKKAAGSVGGFTVDLSDAAEKSANYAKDNAKAVEAATEASIAKTASLWESWFALQEHMDGDNLASKVSNIGRWETSELASLEKSKKNNQDYENQKIAIVEVAAQKRISAAFDEHEAVFKIEMAMREKIDSSADAAEKRFQTQQEARDKYALDNKLAGMESIRVATLALNDFIAQETLSSADYQILKAKEVADEQISTFKDQGQAAVDYAAKVRALQAAQVDAQYVDNKALTDNSYDTLQAIADRAATTYDMMAAQPEKFSSAALQAQAQIYRDAQDKASGYVDVWGMALGQLSEMFVKLGQTAGGNLGQVLSSVGQAVVQLEAAHKATQQTGIDGEKLGGNFGQLSVAFDSNADSAKRMAAGVASAAAISQGAMNVWAATSSHASAAGNALGGAMAGAQAGAAFGPWGMAIGAAAGLVVGLVRGKPEWAKAADEVAKDFGVKISDTLAKTIADEGKKDFGGSSQAAAISHLSDIIKESGGLTEKNLPQLTSRLRDTFSMIETHQMTIAQGTKVLDDNWAAFADAGTDANGRLSKSLREIIQLQGNFGTDSKAIADYLKGQGANDLAYFSSVAAAMLTPDKLSVWDDLKKKVDDATTSNTGFADALAAQKGGADLAASGLKDVGIQAVAAFEAAVASGTSETDALKAIHPALATLEQSYTDLGISTDDAALAAIMMRDKVATAVPTLSTGIAGLSGEMTTLGNMGLLNVDTFAAMERTGQSMYDQLLAKTIELGGTSKDALGQMQKYLHEAVADAEDLGVPLDANTQALIDQSKAAGIWKDAGQSANDTLMIGFTAIIEALGGTIPDAFKKFSKAALDAAKDAAGPGGLGLVSAATQDATKYVDDGSAEWKTWRDTAVKAAKDAADAAAGVGATAATTADQTKVAAGIQVQAWHDVEDAATHAAEGRSPTGVQQVGVRIAEIAPAAAAMAASVTTNLKSVEDTATTVANAIQKVSGQMDGYYGAEGALNNATAAQKEFMKSALEAGASTQDIATILGTTDQAVSLYSKQLSDAAAETKKFEDAQNSAIKSLQDLIASTKTADLSTAATAAVQKLGKNDVTAALTKSQDALAAAQRKKTTDDLQAQLDIADAVLQSTTNGNSVKADALQVQMGLMKQMHDLKAKYAAEDARAGFKEEVAALGMIPAEYARTYADATKAIRDQYADQQQSLVAQRSAELAALGPIPSSYSATYQAAANAVVDKYNILLNKARESTADQLQALGPIPAEYEDTYTRAFDLVTDKYTGLLDALGVTPNLETMQQFADAYESAYTTSFNNIAKQHADLLASLSDDSTNALAPGYKQLSQAAADLNLTGTISNGAYGVGLARGWAAFRDGMLVSEGQWQSSDTQFASADVAAALEAAAKGVSHAASGGLVTPSNIIPFPMRPQGTDTRPAMLTPGESVRTVAETNQYLREGEGGAPSNQDVVDAINGLRVDLSSKLPRSLARSLETALVGVRTA